jgi:hypothetical protein
MSLSFINTSGNIITEDFCQQLLIETKAEYVKSKSFGEGVKKIDEDIAITYEILRERWEEVRSKLIDNELDTSQLRERWIKYFLELLGFVPVFIPNNLKNDAGIDYQIPYRGWNEVDAPLIHMVHSSIDLDARDKNSRTHPTKSPHDLLQQYLNTTHHKWAILTNGKRIRVLRDFYHSITKGFLEFDIEGIFETANTEQFRILYRILHRSRFIGQYVSKIDDGVETTCLLERFHLLSRETGVKVGENLRVQVRIAIETLGNGFGENLNPDDYDDLAVKKFYSEILNIIYRLLFLLFAEQKGWLPVKNDTYARTYSVNYLREKAAKGEYNFDNNEDLWEGLKVTFRLVTKGYKFSNGDTINAFGGQLFSDERIFHIKSPLKNKYLLKAIDALSFFPDKNLKNKINYAALAIDELGSVYESLLDYEPRLIRENMTIDGKHYYRGTFMLDNRSSERKTTGSYYTDSRLVAQLIDSALVPVIENALKNKSAVEEKRKAILDLKVADIACGSGAFLTAALEKLGEYLSLIGKEEGEKPTENELRLAKRDILQNCIYGVDLNPMAVGLAKFSLWITASMPNLPLSFLDHKIKCGNSLIGATPDVIKIGIPVEAYNPVTLDVPVVCSRMKKKVRQELEGYSRKDKGVQAAMDFKVSEYIETDYEANQYLHILNSQQQDVEEVETVAQEYEEVYHALKENLDWKLADAWAASFFIRKDNVDKNYPTNTTLQNIIAGNSISEDLEAEIEALALHYRFFHFHLEFPEVFDKGGFDCILGNPPWEKVQAEETEFFKPYNLVIANEEDSKKRKEQIEFLSIENPGLYKQWINWKVSIDGLSKFCIYSGLYQKSGTGNVNLYKIFLDRSLQSTTITGRIGLIVQSGLFTDELSKDFFVELMSNKNLIYVNDFVNKHKLFGIHPQMRFSLVTASRFNPFNTLFRFYLTQPEQLFENSIGVEIDFDTIKLVNPNTFNCPMINEQRTLDILKLIYKNSSVVKSDDDSINSYGCDFWGEMFNMTRGEKFLWKDCIDFDFELSPLYESKYFHQYDHRFATFKDVVAESRIKGNARLMTTTEKISLVDLEYRYFVRKELVISKSKSYKIANEWFLCLRSITSSTNERTVISSILPKFGIANSINIALPKNLEDVLFLLGAFNSFVLDFVASTKVGNQNLNIFIIKQLPIPKRHIIKIINKNQIITDKILRLSYTSKEIESFAHDNHFYDSPISWNEQERFLLKCELDAIYAHLYGLDKADLAYILEAFPIVKRKDLEKFGNYRTKETILNFFDELQWVREEINLTNSN